MEYNIGDKLGNKICVGKVRVNPTIINDEPEFHYIWKNTTGSPSSGNSGNNEDRLALKFNGTLSEYKNNSVTKLPAEAFANLRYLTTVDLPACSIIGHNAFGYCSALSNVNIPACTSIDAYAFQRCSSLTSVNFPKCTSIEDSAFAYCSALTNVSFPVCTMIDACAFSGCTNLSSANFPVCAYIGFSAFLRCTSLTTLILGASSVCNLGASGAFSNTAIYNGTGYVYVPASLVDAYKSATNWTYYSSRISAIESMPV